MALRVFISYTHDSQQQMDRVWDLSETLRRDGVDCRVDQQEESPAEGWPRWMKNQVKNAQFVLAVCTERYLRQYEGKGEAGKGFGARWEGSVITEEIYEAAGRSARFIPVVFSPDDAHQIPTELRGTTYYDLSEPDNYDKLFRHLTAQPSQSPAPLGPSFTGREKVLRQQFKELTERRGVDSDHPLVGATFLTSFEKLAKQNPAAAELLQATAFLAPDAIPEEIFTEGAAEFGPVLQAAAADPLKWNEAIGAAVKFSLLEHNPAEKLLIVPRIVQVAMNSHISVEERAKRAKQVVRAVNVAFPKVEFAAWDECERLVPSAQVCAALVDEYGLSLPEAARLLNEAGYYLHQRARYVEAEPLYRRALAIYEKVLGREHPYVADTLNNLAQLLQATNRLGEAEPLMRQAVTIDEHSYGPDHPDVATDLNNLAQLLQDTNRLGEAEPLMRRALEINERSYGPDHPNVAIRLNNLAQLLKDTNRLGEAEPLMRHAVQIFEKAYGPDHPNVATSLNNLAALLQATNRLGEAEPLMRRALEIDERAYGPDHPALAIDLSNLAQLLQATNRLDEAEPLYRRALAIWVKALGPDHPQVAIGLNNLAQLLDDTGRLGEAEPLMRRMLEIFVKFTRDTGHQHPHLQAAITNYANLLEQMGCKKKQVEAKLKELGASL